ncbi:MAG: GerMN domain-containing protein [bacterium]|nr:GerMN domain-containing protein [bacterium]
MKKIIIIVIIILGAILYFATQGKNETPPDVLGISNFEACATAGYPIQESYPERCTTPDGKTFTRDIGNELEKSDLIVLETPRSGQVISSPVVIKGRARGNWYFEASFPARLVDANGKVLGTMPIQATGEWMTTEFVPFTATMDFTTPSTKTGTLILQKDNPSGLPENDDELRIPVTFSAFDPNTGEKTAIKVFFGNSVRGAECEEVISAIREVPKVATIGKAAIEELLKGPTTLEQSQGFSTALNPNVKVNSLSISNGIARVDFSSDLNTGVAGSCRVQAIRAQIEETLKQFPTVQNVSISVSGKTENILEP